MPGPVHMEWKKILIIYKNSYVSFHCNLFYSDWTEKEPTFLHGDTENGNFKFSVCLTKGTFEFFCLDISGNTPMFLSLLAFLGVVIA